MDDPLKVHPSCDIAQDAFDVVNLRLQQCQRANPLFPPYPSASSTLLKALDTLLHDKRAAGPADCPHVYIDGICAAIGWAYTITHICEPPATSDMKSIADLCNRAQQQHYKHSAKRLGEFIEAWRVGTLDEFCAEFPQGTNS